MNKLWLGVIAFAFVLAVSLTPSRASGDRWNPSDDAVYKSLAWQMDHMFTRTDIDLAQGERGRLFAWSWGYLGRAALLMQEATGEKRFLDLVRDTSHRLLENRDDTLGLVDGERGAIVPSWQVKYNFGGKSNEITAAGLITLPMCEYALKTGDEKIGREAVKSLNAFIGERREAHGGYYFWHLSQKIVEPLNHSHIYGAALATCSKLSYAPDTFAETAKGIYRYWRHFTRADGEGLSWAYMPAPDSPLDQKSEAIWKMGVTIELPVALVKHGLMADDGILDLLGKTVTGNSIVRAGGVPQFIGEGLLIDISKGEKFHRRSLAGLMSPVVLLDNPAVTGAFLKMVRDHPKLYPNGWFGGSKSMMFSYAYLRANGGFDNTN
ncbi:hypothetical protein [Pseudahrensia aquimaris]|uniref:hypothetical protein n=1 Tax=Pseudahrensia aquimaris TaxID=744461 RepID=UPI00366AD601